MARHGNGQRCAANRRRTGASMTVSIAIGMAIFVLAVATMFVLLQDIVYTNDQFGVQIERAADNAVQRLQQQTAWSVHQLPVIIHAPAAVPDTPVHVSTPLPADTVPSSVLVTGNGREIASYRNVSTNETVFIADLSPGANRFNIVYITDTAVDLADRSYGGGLATSSAAVWDQTKNVTFDTSGFEQITYNGRDVFAAPADLGGSTTPQVAANSMAANVTYGSSRNVQMYNGSGRIPVVERFTGTHTYRFNLSTRFTTMYADGSTTDLNQTGDLYSGTTGFVDFYNASGFAVVGDDLTVNVSRETTSAPIAVQVDFTDTDGRKPVWFHVHDGNYTNARPQRHAFHNGTTQWTGVPESVDGVSAAKAGAFGEQSDQTVKDSLGLDRVSYNISLPGVMHSGQPIRTTGTVSVKQHPVPVVARFANATVQQLQLRVWPG